MRMKGAGRILEKSMLRKKATEGILKTKKVIGNKNMKRRRWRRRMKMKKRRREERSMIYINEVIFIHDL